MPADFLCVRVKIVGDAIQSDLRASVGMTNPHLQHVAVRLGVEERILRRFGRFDANDLSLRVDLDDEFRVQRNLRYGWRREAACRRGVAASTSVSRNARTLIRGEHRELPPARTACDDDLQVAALAWLRHALGRLFTAAVTAASRQRVPGGVGLVHASAFMRVVRPDLPRGPFLGCREFEGNVPSIRLFTVIALALALLAAPASAARPIVDLHKLDAYFALFASDSNVPWQPTTVRLDTYSSAPVQFPSIKSIRPMS